MPKTLSQFKKQFPDVWLTYEQLRNTCSETGPLDQKTVELIKVGISAALAREGGLVAHVSKARKAGAKKPEIYQAMFQGLGLAGFPTILSAYRIVRKTLKG